MPALRVLVIEVGASHVAWARFRVPRRGRLVLERLSITDHPAAAADEHDPAASLGQALATRLRPDDARGACALVLPAHLAMTRFLRTPALDRAQRVKIVAFEAQQNVPYPLSDVVWDHMVAGERGHDLEVLLVAAKRATVAAVCGASAAHRLRPSHVQPAAIALVHAYRHRYGEQPGGALLVAIGARSTLLVFVEDRRFFFRSIALGGSGVTQQIADELKLGFAEAEGVKLRVLHRDMPATEERLPERVVHGAAAQFIGRLRLEITRSIASCRREQGPVVERVYLSGGGSMLPGLPERMAAALRLPVARFDLRRSLEIPRGFKDLPWHRLVEMTGLAAALQTGAAETVNLLPASLRREQAFRQAQPWWLAAAALLVLGLAWPGLHHRRMAQSASAAATEVERITPALIALQARVAARADHLAQVQRQSTALAAVVAARHAWIGFLDDLQQRLAIPGEAWVDRLQVLRAPPADPPAGWRGSSLFGAPRPDPAVAPSPATRLMLSGRLIDRSTPASAGSEAMPVRIQRLLDELQASPFVAAVEEERFEVSPAGLLRFELVIVLDAERPL